MKKSLIVLMMILMSLVSVNAVSLEVEQSNNIYDYKIASLGLSFEDFVIGLDSQDNFTKQVIGNYTGDIKIQLRGVTKPVYLIIENNDINNTIFITYVNDDAVEVGTIVEKIAINQELTMQEKGTYYFKFVPSYEGESFDFMIDAPLLSVFTYYVKEEQPQEFNSLVSGFVSSFQEIVSYNVTLWKVMFYFIVFALTTGFIVALFGGSFYLLKKAKYIREKGLE